MNNKIETPNNLNKDFQCFSNEKSSIDSNINTNINNDINNANDINNLELANNISNSNINNNEQINSINLNNCNINSNNNINNNNSTTATRHIWTPNEDKLLRNCVDMQIKQNGTKEEGKFRINWKIVAEKFLSMYKKGLTPHLRTGKQCRERWRNHVGVDEHKEWNKEEEKKLFELNMLYSNKWSKIAKLMGRPENEIKNKFHVSIRKKITDLTKKLKLKIDPKKLYNIAIKKKILILDVNERLVIKLYNNLNNFNNSDNTNNKNKLLNSKRSIKIDNYNNNANNYKNKLKLSSNSPFQYNIHNNCNSSNYDRGNIKVNCPASNTRSSKNKEFKLDSSNQLLKKNFVDDTNKDYYINEYSKDKKINKQKYAKEEFSELILNGNDDFYDYNVPITGYYFVDQFEIFCKKFSKSSA